MIIIALLLGLGSPARAEHADSIARFKGGALGPAANCDFALKRRADRLEAIGEDFPEVAFDFRRAFKWSRIEHKGVVQLRGVPRPPPDYHGAARPEDDPPFFVVVPLNPAPMSAVMVINVRPRRDELRLLLRTEAENSKSTFNCVANRQAHVEHGIHYDRLSLDVVFFAEQNGRASTVGQGMALALKLAHELYRSQSNILVKLGQQHGDVGRAFLDAFVWTDVKEVGLVVKSIGRPPEKEFAEKLWVEVERDRSAKFLDLRLFLHPSTLKEYQAFGDAFHPVQSQRQFKVDFIQPEKPRLKLVEAPEPMGKLRAYFPGNHDEGKASLHDGLKVAMEALKELRRLRTEADGF